MHIHICKQTETDRQTNTHRQTCTHLRAQTRVYACRHAYTHTQACTGEGGRVKELSAQAIANVLWASAASCGGAGGVGLDLKERGIAAVDRHVSDVLFESLRAEVVVRGFGNFSAHGIASVVWAFVATGRGTDDVLFLAENEALRRGLENIGAKSLSTLVWAFGKESSVRLGRDTEGAGHQAWVGEALFGALGVLLRERRLFLGGKDRHDIAPTSAVSAAAALGTTEASAGEGGRASWWMEAEAGEAESMEVDVEMEEGDEGWAGSVEPVEWQGQQFSTLVWGISLYGGKGGSAGAGAQQEREGGKVVHAEDEHDVLATPRHTSPREGGGRERERASEREGEGAKKQRERARERGRRRDLERDELLAKREHDREMLLAMVGAELCATPLSSFTAASLCHVAYHLAVSRTGISCALSLSLFQYVCIKYTHTHTHTHLSVLFFSVLALSSVFLAFLSLSL